MLYRLKLLLKGSMFYPIYNYFRIQNAVKKWEEAGKKINPPIYLKLKLLEDMHGIFQ